MGAFLQYSNETHSNIIPQEEFEELTQEVFGVIASNISKSLGPLGSSATILDGMMTEATKDGHAILKKYRFHNRYKKMIYNLIKAPCTKLNNTVGDATTTVICLANAIFNRYKQEKEVINTLYRLPRHFTKAWEEVVDALTHYVVNQARQIDPKDYDTIYNIAYVVSNGSAEISDNIAKIYQEVGSPSIKQKDSPTNKSYINSINGFDFPANLISESFAKNEDLSVTENDMFIIVMDHKLETDYFESTIKPIIEVVRAQRKKLLILAPYFDGNMCDSVIAPYINMELMKYGASSFMMAQFELGKLEKNQMTDLAVILKGIVITQERAKILTEEIVKDGIDIVFDNMIEDKNYVCYRYIGQAKKAFLSCTNGSIFYVENIEDDETYQDTLRRAEWDLADIRSKVDYEQQSYAAKIYDANNRINQLKMKNYIYYIGADSALQKQIIWDSVEDVIKCVRSATKSGVVPGCQITLVRGCDLYGESLIGCPLGTPEAKEKLENIKDDTILLKLLITNIIRNAVVDVYHMVLHGADGMGVVKLIPRWQYTTPEGNDALRDEAIDKARNIIKESIQRNQVFDIESLEYSDKIITSAETDVMVLSAASELVKILISGNQCIFLDADVNETHQETMEVYG